jgi:Ca2+-binding RTX toxin-like protein
MIRHTGEGMSGGVSQGTEAADSLAGGDGDDLIFGSGGDDTMDGAAGRVTVSGQEGSDGLRGGDGDDLVLGGSGNDTIEGDRTVAESFPELEPGVGDDFLFGGDGNDFLFAGRGDDSVFGDAGDNVAQGASGRDAVFGGDGDDRLWGGRPQLVFFDLQTPEDGPDLVRGGDGNDEINGDRGNDTLLGERGDDTLRGGFDADTLAGGEGSDLFAFGTRETDATQSTRGFIDRGLGGEVDVVLDFRQGEGDRIDLSAINGFSLRFIAVGDFAFAFVGAEAFSGQRPEVRYDILGDRTVAQLDGVSVRVVSLPGPGGAPAVVDVPVDGVADAEIVLAGQIALQERDFIL